MKSNRKFRLLRNSTLGLLAMGPFYLETNYGLFSAKYFTAVNEGLIASTPTTQPPPATGPIDQELGYDHIESWRSRLQDKGFKVSPQREWVEHSVFPSLASVEIGPFGAWKVPPVFDRPVGRSFAIRDNGKNPIFTAQPPAIYKSYDEISPFLISALSLVEDRRITDDDLGPEANPALDLPRLAIATAQQVGKHVGLRANAAGGSTLATQVAKNVASKGGRTRNTQDKAAQIAQASLLAYSQGEDTTAMRREIIRAYMNSVGFGQHRGFRAGMAYFFNRTDYDRVLNQGLSNPLWPRVAREALTMVMAVQKPSEVLLRRDGFDASQRRLIEVFLPLMVKENVMTPQQAESIKQAPFSYSDVGRYPASAKIPQYSSKYAESLRLHTLALLGEAGPADALHRMNRYDLVVQATLDGRVNDAVTTYLQSLNDPETARAKGLVGEKLLAPAQKPYQLTYALTVSEIDPTTGIAHTLISTDTSPTQFDISRMGKTGAGSTAKRRMLSTYLQIIAEDYDALRKMSADERAKLKVHPKDDITQWLLTYINDPKKDQSRLAMLRAATERDYSASPQCFFTGEGMLCPGNFDKASNGRRYTVAQALEQSINLTSIRFTDSIIQHIKYFRQGVPHEIMDAQSMDMATQQQRAQYVRDFVLHESGVFHSRAFVRLKGRKPDEILATLANRGRHTPTALASIFYSVMPDAPYDDMVAFIKSSCAKRCDADKADMPKLYEQFAPSPMADIASQIAATTKKTPEAIMQVYRDIHPNASYVEARAFLGRMLPDLDPFKDMTTLYAQAKPDLSDARTTELARFINRQAAPETPSKKVFSEAEQLTALYLFRHPTQDISKVQQFIRQTAQDPQSKKADLRPLHARYASGTYTPDARYYPFDINDRAYLAKVNPMWLEVARLLVHNPDLTLKDSLKQTESMRLYSYKWLLGKELAEGQADGLLRTGKRSAQNRAISIMTEREAWHTVTGMWKKLGYPFTLPPTLANVLGSGGDNLSSMATYTGILLNGGRAINPTDIQEISAGSGTPFEMHARPSPSTQQQLLLPEVAAVALEVTSRGVMSAQGTSHRLQGLFKDAQGRALPAEGKTGTNAELPTLDFRAAYWTGSVGGRYSITLMAYSYNQPHDGKFTSGLPVRILQGLAPVLNPLFSKPAISPMAMLERLNPSPSRQPTGAPSLISRHLPFIPANPTSLSTISALIPETNDTGIMAMHRPQPAFVNR